MVGRKVPGVAGYKQGIVASSRGPDDRVGQPKAVGPPDVYGLIRHGLCDGKEFKPPEKTSEEAFLFVTLSAD